MVFPGNAPDTARVGLGYRKTVPHARVRQEIARLAKVSGWQIDNDLVIKDGSAWPGDPKRFPVTTAAMFSLLHAPQVRDSAPQLGPYLTAFQSWDHVEVIFVLPDLTPYNGVVNFESKPLTVQLIQGESNYRYDADIRDHTGLLPSLPTASHTVTSPTAPSTPTVSRSARSAPSLALPYALMILGAGLMVGVSAFLMFTRRTSR